MPRPVVHLAMDGCESLSTCESAFLIYNSGFYNFEKIEYPENSEIRWKMKNWKSGVKHSPRSSRNVECRALGCRCKQSARHTKHTRTRVQIYAPKHTCADSALPGVFLGPSLASSWRLLGASLAPSGAVLGPSSASVETGGCLRGPPRARGGVFGGGGLFGSGLRVLKTVHGQPHIRRTLQCACMCGGFEPRIRAPGWL